MSHNDNSINNATEAIHFNLNKSVQVCKIKTYKDASLMKSDPIFTMIDITGRRQSFLSPISGTVTKLYIHELDVLSFGSLILEYAECRHPIIFNNLCSGCGLQLNPSEPVISMDPSFPGLTITREEGSKYDNEERQLLLRKRKLHLLVDLDQTLVHTTDSRNYYPSSSDIVSYQLTPVAQTFHTKLRPGVRTFLTNLQPFYQFFLITFGDRLYANTIANLIDPNRRFFYHRILSRDECLSLTDKTANLSSLFPCGDSLVCIIDDREDVWNCAPNLVQVKPYTWFRNVRDFNDTYLPSRNEKRTSDGESVDKLNDNAEDTDLYLHQLENILKRIHTVFYQTYDQWIQDKQGPIPDLKQIMPDIRQQILSSVSLCFSHLMPQDYPLEKHRATIIARAMGAQVTADLQFDSDGKIQTTHVIAGKSTLKVYQARQNKIKVVTPEWLLDCYEHWEKRPEEYYVFTPGYNVRKSRLFTDETPRVTKRRHHDTQQKISVVEQSLSDQPCNVNMNIDERLDIEKRVNDLSIADDDDEFDDIRPRPKKQQRTMMSTETVQDGKDRSDNEDSDSDSSYHFKLLHLVLNKENDPGSDEGGLSDDEMPRGWKEDHTSKPSHV